ncbi:iron-containing alcohol dehydrogenase [Niveispirillum sp. BGYR6]|uniref:iron-containing alcohol dehydrogenase n=1 Tax=Niveispirillum sp. BGYR6 TaxID=2971249 RepID=UPI0022B97EA6|nr:iron-containing alcohol dehydrogenase [Niveispirillum sp. BGYR6]MDG5493591.1 iron-containing alcohol dehydrogenase [Niveispirillum sp. BGYR6]
MSAPSFRFRYGPRVLSGPGTAGQVADHLPAGPCLLVTDKGVRSLGLLAPVLEALEKAGIPVSIFDAVEPDPSRETVLATVAAGRSAGAVSVLGVGGGSPMDVAKLAAYLLASGDDLETIWGVEQAKGKRLPLLLVPTTAGTGSEATPVTVISVGNGEKRGVSAGVLLPDVSVLDPLLTLGLPPHVTAATGIDAMVHAIESYTSARLKNPMSDMLAREALRLLSANLLKACRTPGDVEARSAMLLGAHLAGVAFANAPVAGVHALAYPLGGLFHVPHGLSNALVLPHVMAFNMPAAAPLYAELAPLVDPSLAGLSPATQAEGLVAAMVTLSRESGLPQQMRAVGVMEADLPQMAKDAMLQQRLLVNNPRPILEADALAIYQAAW